MTKIIQQRKRIFIAGEGEGEQSFVKWLQRLSDQHGLHVHLDCQPLGGVVIKQCSAIPALF